MIGGALDPLAVALPDDELIGLVRGDLERAMGVRVAPERRWIFRHRGGISQYVVGHGERLARIAHALDGLPGLEVAGQSYFGISMNACIEHAAVLAERVVGRLATQPVAAGR